MKKRLIFGLSLALMTTVSEAATISIDLSDTKQKVVGFGGGVVYYQSWITALGSEMQTALYDTAFTGLNLSLLRVGNWLQDTTASIDDDVTIVSAAKERLGDHMKILMSSWSAPASLKPSGDVNGNVANGDSSKATLNASSSDVYGKYAYGDFAHWWKVSYQKYQAQGISPDFISLQNEPDMFATYAETIFAPTETSKRAGYAQALAAVYDSIKSLPNPPKIVGPEPLGIGYGNFQNYMKALDDSKLDGYAYHLYHAGNGNDNSLSNYNSPENFRSAMTSIASAYGSDEKPLIMTEFCTMSENGKEEYMTGLAHIMQVGFTAGKLNGYIAWELLWGEGKGQLIGVCTKGWGSCTEDQIVISPEYHALRHYSKFVNPGWKVVTSAVTGAAELYPVAFLSANGDSLTLVVVNEGSAAESLSAGISGYVQTLAVQSVENGVKSQMIATGEEISLPGNSITTIVYQKPGTAIPAKAALKKFSGKTTVYDLQGNLVWSGILSESELSGETLRLQGLNAGVYLVKSPLGTVKRIKR